MDNGKDSFQFLICNIIFHLVYQIHNESCLNVNIKNFFKGYLCGSSTMSYIICIAVEVFLKKSWHCIEHLLHRVASKENHDFIR